MFLPHSIEAVCSLPLLSGLVDDYFAYLHPLMPFPHERTFRQALSTRNSQPKSFVPLVASMVGCLIILSPPKAKGNLRALAEEKIAKIGLKGSAEHYHELAVRARGLGFLDRTLTVEDAATSFFLGLIGAKLTKWRQAELYFGECQNILRTLGFHKTAESAMSPTGSGPSSASGEMRPALDNITQEMGRRIFWALYMISSSTPSLETFFAESIASTHVNITQFPPLPTETDDAYIYSNHMVPPPASSVPKIVGFKDLALIDFAKNASSTASTVYGADNFGWDTQRQQHIKQSILKCAHIFNSIPLILQGTSSSTFPWACYFETQGDVSAMANRDHLALDILKAEILVSYLGASASLIDRGIALDDGIGATPRMGSTSTDTFSQTTPMAPFSQTYQPQGLFPAAQEMIPNFSPPMSGRFEYMPPGTPARSPEWSDNGIWAQREDTASKLLTVFGGLGRLNLQMGIAASDLVSPLA